MKLTAIAFILLTALLTAVSVFWADWIIRELFNKDINNWLILAVKLIISLFIPRALSGLLTLVYIVASFYILFIR
jgi:hypothetical protein